ncbi:uncharacterized protein BJX67DRAFT_377068 [Aspergillus lucknowensis]|uniref:Uncharacterized protein n=1 Tax=Aspergillus lucknowensis TaxID=176173 RepID=A0ABR4M3X8_9EURO
MQAQPPSSTIETSPFQAHVDSLHSLPLDTTIQALHSLLPRLTTSISPTGTRLVSHPDHAGLAKLDDLGRLYLDAAGCCTREHAAFKTRLLHVSLDKIVEEVYIASEDQLEKGLKDGTVKIPPLGPDEDPGCACCRGDPDAVILSSFHWEEALYYLEDEYNVLWQGEESSGGKYGRGWTWLKASKEQVEREVAKTEAASKL